MSIWPSKTGRRQEMCNLNEIIVALLWSTHKIHWRNIFFHSNLKMSVCFYFNFCQNLSNQIKSIYVINVDSSPNISLVRQKVDCRLCYLSQFTKVYTFKANSEKSYCFKSNSFMVTHVQHFAILIKQVLVSIMSH